MHEEQKGGSNQGKRDMGNTGIKEKCSSCGGSLRLKNKLTYYCENCGQEYYISTDKTHRVSIRLTVSRIIVMIAAAVIAAVLAAVAAYEIYTGRLAEKASRFSVAFRDFLLEVYDRPLPQISAEDLKKIRYLKIEKDKTYQFTYSFEDYYEYDNRESYEKTLETVEVTAIREDFSPANLEYFSGLTRVELYTEAWENYVLPKENQLRYISCNDGLSRYGKSKFFSSLNPDTIEEVVINNAQDLRDYSFLKDLTDVKVFTLQDAVLKNVNDFKNMKALEELSLKDLVMDEEKVYENMEELLSLPSLKKLTISGSSIWYITEEQWAQLQETYEGKIEIRRE